VSDQNKAGGKKESVEDAAAYFQKQAGFAPQGVPGQPAPPPQAPQAPPPPPWARGDAPMSETTKNAAAYFGRVSAGGPGAGGSAARPPAPTFSGPTFSLAGRGSAQGEPAGGAPASAAPPASAPPAPAPADPEAPAATSGDEGRGGRFKKFLKR